MDAGWFAPPRLSQLTRHQRRPKKEIRTRRPNSPCPRGTSKLTGELTVEEVQDAVERPYASWYLQTARAYTYRNQRTAYGKGNMHFDTMQRINGNP